MKKQVFLLFAALLFSHAAFAYYEFSAVAPSGQTLYYIINSGGNGEVSVSYPGSSYSNGYDGYTEPTGSLVIPSSVTYNGTTYSVVEIGWSAFCNCTGLTSVTIPNSVVEIGGSAFRDCTGLTSVTIPNSVVEIGGYAFYHCTGLTSVSIGNSVTSIGSSAFSHCTGLTEVTIPNSVVIIDENAFYWCAGLTSVTFNADSCVYAGNFKAFDGCSNINTFTFGNNVKIIPSVLCSGLTGLTSVTIGNSVTSIGNDAFRGCRGLTSVHYTGTIGDWCGINFVSETANPLYFAHHLFINNTEITLATIPNSVTSIGDYAFIRCIGLTSVMFGNSVNNIGKNAFRDCTGLTSLTFTNPEPPTIGTDVFSGTATNIITVNVPCGSLSAYGIRLPNFIHFEEVYTSFTAESEDVNKGTVRIVTMPSCTDHTAVLQAVPANGYHFDHWSTGSTDNPYTLTVSDSMVITAYFASDGGTSRIDDVEDNGIGIRVTDGRIHVRVDGEIANEFHVYDVTGREVFRATHADNTPALPRGIYLVKVGTLPARKVVVIR